MKKGKFGIVLPLYAVVAMLLAIFGQTIGLIELTFFVIAVEKDEWVSKQCLQALAAVGLTYIVSTIVTLIEKPFDWLLLVVTANGFSRFANGYDKFFNFGYSVIEVVITILLIVAVFNVAKGKDAKIPIASKFADWAYGIVAPKPAPAPVQATPVQNVAPVQNAVPVQNATPAQDAPVAKFCPNCGKEIHGAFCNHCGTKI